MAAPLPISDEPDPDARALIAARPHLSLHAHDGLCLEGVPLAHIARELGTPSWVYSAGTIRARLASLKAALADAGLDAHVHYAVKANDHLAVLRLMAVGGAGADVVSEGELLRAREAGIAAADIVFSGVGKTATELRAALELDIGQINVESAEELEMLSAIAASMGRIARIALRVNPDVDAGTHAKISTGRARDKFGIAYADIPTLYARAAAMPGISPVGIATHIGSQILSMAPYRAAYARMADLVRALRAGGQTVAIVDCGGGIGIGYRDEPGANPAALAGAIKASLHNMDVKLLLEPGRWLVGPAGVLLAAVVLVKRTPGARFVVLDAAMNDLVRPAMYEAYHGILPVSPVSVLGPASPADIVGPVCESGDTFARGRMLADVAAGDFMALLDTGAYGAVMSSTYNARPLAAVAMVDGERWAVIRPRQSHRALWEHEAMPDFLI